MSEKMSESKLFHNAFEKEYVPPLRCEKCGKHTYTPCKLCRYCKGKMIKNE